MKNKENLKVIIVVIITLVVVIGTVIYNNLKEKDNIELSIVTNYSEFFTVNSCIDRAINYVIDKETKNLILLTNDTYKKKNSINQSNILSIYPNLDDDCSFSAKDMYYEKVNENVTKYYVYGELITSYEYKFISEEYFIVYLDREKGLFSIEPYKGDVFKGGVENE